MTSRNFEQLAKKVRKFGFGDLGFSAEVGGWGYQGFEGYVSYSQYIFRKIMDMGSSFGILIGAILNYKANPCVHW